MQQLTSAQVRELRAKAHALNPVVSISDKGLSAAVLKEIDTCLKAHELIKVRVHGDDREHRLACLETICRELDAAPVQHIGKLLVVYRENPEKPAAAKAPAKPRAAAPRRSKRSFQG
ncbi:MAG: ribosome assembly RNA-binding protein YhbY [Betaproteobacteria bacterium]|nr:ribosome assembly RNA-binding protein YhbY [Betaproteobacteria bacterium]MCL2886393.1 ribosome assembly RNA-binding protein YhbY [Betaproteobacteria bacterium]